MKLKKYRFLFSPEGDSFGGGGGGSSPIIPNQPTPQELVAHRKKIIAQKEASREISRKNRFSRSSDKKDEKNLEEEEDFELEEEEEEHPNTGPQKSKPDKIDPDKGGEEEDDDFLFDDEEEDPDEEEEKDPDEEEEEEEEGEDHKEDESQRVKTLRNKVKEEGKRRKDAEVRLVALESEAEELREQLSKEKEKSKNLASQNIDWSKHEEVNPLWAEFDDHIYHGAVHIGDPIMSKQFVRDAQRELLAEYHNMTKGVKTLDERIDKDAEFSSILQKRYGVADAHDVVASIGNALKSYMKIEDKVKELETMHSNNTLAVGVNEYSKLVSPYESHINDLGLVDEEFVEASPNSVEAIVGSKYQSDDSFKKKADKYKRELSQLVFGLRPLTQDELKRAEKFATGRGMTIDQYIKKREENFEKKRIKFINDSFYHKMIMDDFDEIYSNHTRVVNAKNKRKVATKTINSKVNKPAVKNNTSSTDKKKVFPGHPDWVPVTQRIRERRNS